MVMPMQDPQSYEDDAGNVYVREGGRYRVIRAGSASQASPRGAASGYRIQPMISPTEQRAQEAQTYQRGRDEVRDQLTATREDRANEAAARQAAAAERAAQNLTDKQGDSLQYGTMMRGAETDYQAALANGYRPTSIRNAAANLLDRIPWDGGAIPALIRDPQSDRGYQAERRWAEANLRQLTGAAASSPEITRVAGINFDRANDSLSDQRYRTRQDTYGATRLAAGSAKADLPEEYPSPVRSELPAYSGPAGQEATAIPASAELRKGPDGKMYAVVASEDISPQEAERLVASGEYQRDPATGAIFRNVGPAQLPPEGPAPPSPSGPQGGGQSGYDTALQQERANADLVARAGGGVDMDLQFTAPLNDEMAYVAGYAGQGLGNIGRRLTGQNIEVTAAERGAASRDVMRQDQDRFAREHPGQNAGAMVLGGAALGPGNAARTMVGRMAQSAAVGAPYAFAAADGNVVERAPAAVIGAVTAAVATPAIEKIAAPIIGGAANALTPVGRFAARQVGRVGNALNIPGAAQLVESAQPNALAAGMGRFAQQSPQDVNALNANASRYRAEEISPAFADVVNDGGRGTMRALATRQTPARQAAREFTEGRAASLQDRVSTQARRTISDDPRQPAQIREEITTRRNQQADQQFGAVRGDRISPDREILEALRTPAMRPAIEEAATSAANRGDMETAGALRALAGDAMDYGADAQITVGMADRIARSLNGRAEALQRSGNNDAAASHFALAERLRGGARRQAPGYDEALKSYGQDSGLAAATELGEQFMTMEADAFAAAMARLSPEEQQIAQAAARRAIERQAGTQGQAPGVAQRLANGREQGARTSALTGDAAPVQRAMATELETLRNAQAINPGQGSQTSQNLQDAMGAAGATKDLLTANVPGLASRAMSAIRARGFNDAEANAVVQAAIDPARTDELIGMLAQRMNRLEARNLARAIRYQISTSLQSGQQQ